MILIEVHVPVVQEKFEFKADENRLVYDIVNEMRQVISKKLREEEADAARINEKNAAESSGRISGRPKRAVYTAADVFAMSASEVRDNYEDIILSMEQNGFYQD